MEDIMATIKRSKMEFPELKDPYKPIAKNRANEIIPTILDFFMPMTCGNVNILGLS
jgi:hypothetical protein